MRIRSNARRAYQVHDADDEDRLMAGSSAKSSPSGSTGAKLPAAVMRCAGLGRMRCAPDAGRRAAASMGAGMRRSGGVRLAMRHC